MIDTFGQARLLRNFLCRLNDCELADKGIDRSEIEDDSDIYRREVEYLVLRPF
jgi:hypothetical protein